MVLTRVQKGLQRMITSLLESVLKLQEIDTISVGRNMKGSSRIILSIAWEEKFAVALLFTLCFNKMWASRSSHLKVWPLLRLSFMLEIIHVYFLDIVYGV